MERISKNMLWAALACSGMLILTHCSSSDSIQPNQRVTSHMPPPPEPPKAGNADTGRADTNKVYTFVEQMPSFPGGDKALMQYLSNHIQYPAEARKQGLSGTVVVRFIIGTDGSIRNVTTIGTPKGGGLEQEAIAVVKEMPKWIPGRQDGKAVTLQYNLPIRYVSQ